MGLLRIEESDEDCFWLLSNRERSTKQRRTSNGIISVDVVLVESKWNKLNSYFFDSRKWNFYVSAFDTQSGWFSIDESE